MTINFSAGRFAWILFFLSLGLAVILTWQLSSSAYNQAKEQSVSQHEVCLGTCASVSHATLNAYQTSAEIALPLALLSLVIFVVEAVRHKKGSLFTGIVLSLLLTLILLLQIQYPALT